MTKIVLHQGHYYYRDPYGAANNMDAALLTDPSVSREDVEFLRTNTFDVQGNPVALGENRWIKDGDNIMGWLFGVGTGNVLLGLVGITLAWGTAALLPVIVALVTANTIAVLVAFGPSKLVRRQKRLRALTGKYVILREADSKSNYAALATVTNAIYSTRAYQEAWVDKPKVRMLIDEEAWRITQRLRTVTAVEGNDLTRAQKDSTALVRAKIKERLGALDAYHRALLDIDAKLVEADMLRDREIASGTIVDLLAEIEGDRAIALTKALTDEANAVQAAISEAINKAKIAATEIHALHAVPDRS